VFGKADGLVGRIALILWALDWAWGDEDDLSRNISLEYVERAIFFRENYIKPMQIRIWQHAMETEERKNARHVAEWIAANRPSVVNLSDLRLNAGIPGVSVRSPAEVMEQAVKHLIGHHWPYPIELEKRGRGAPRKDYGINDRLYELLDAS